MSLTPWLLVRKRNVPTQRLLLVSEFWCQFLLIEGCRGGTPTVAHLRFLDWSRYFVFQVAPYLRSTRLSGTPFQSHCYSEKLVAPGIEPKTSESASKNFDH
jgi:hypothetical protein